MTSRSFAWPVVLAAGAVLACPDVAARQDRTASLVRLFELYDRGDYATFDNEIGRATDKGAWPGTHATGESWIKAAAGAEGHRRRLVAASVLAEWVRVRTKQWDQLRELLETGCEWLGKERPLSAERFWHRAVAALSLSVGDYRFFPAWRPWRPAAKPDEWFEHFRHGDARFKGDSVLALLESVAVEQESYWSVGDVRHPGRADPDQIRHLIGPALRLEPEVRLDRDLTERWFQMVMSTNGVLGRALTTNVRLWRLVDRWSALLDDPVVAPEAYVRLGQTYLRLARPDLALPAFQRADELDGDPYVAYLARLFGGEVLEDHGYPAEAAHSFQAALQAVPRAAAASLRLAALKYRDGAVDEAGRLMADVFRPPTVTDPFQRYGTGDPKWLDEAFAELRKVLRR